MILDRLENSDCYRSLHPLFGKIFDYLKRTDGQALKVGRIDFPDGFYINVDEVALRPKEEALLEVHDKYIDIQLPITQSEEVGWKSRQACLSLKSSSEERDISFFSDSPDSYFRLEPGSFAIFFPQDAHAPIIGRGKTRKVVVKVPVSHLSNETMGE